MGRVVLRIAFLAFAISRPFTYVYAFEGSSPPYVDTGVSVAISILIFTCNSTPLPC
jgi:hypothetical protein